MRKTFLFAAFSVALAGCVYSPTPGPTVAATPGGYTLNDNGYQAYYSTKVYPIVDCKSAPTQHCQDRLDYDANFCANWTASGKFGDSAVTSEPSNEIWQKPPACRGWLW